MNLLKSFFGSVTLKISGAACEKFINICNYHDIELSNIKRIGKNTFSVTMEAKFLKEVAPIAKKTHTKIKIIKKHGFFRIKKKIKKRNVFFIGMLFCVCIIYASSLFVWSVEMTDCSDEHKEQLLSDLSSLGCAPGALKSRIDPVKIKNEMMYRDDFLNWIWVKIEGCRAYVSVIEKKPKPQGEGKEICNIISKKDAVIKKVTPKSGSAAVSPGDTVLKGRILISSKIESEKEDTAPHYVHASGSVIGTVSYEKSIVTEKKRIEKVYGGDEEKKYHISLFGKNIPLYFSEPKYLKCDVFSSTKTFSLGNLSLSVVCDKYCEYEEISVPVDEEEAVRIAADKLRAEADFDSAGICTYENITYTQNDDSTLTVTLRREYEEEIGEASYMPIASENEKNEKN